MTPSAAPGGAFVAVRREEGALWVERDLADAAVAAGLDRVEGWTTRLAGAEHARPGRGATARLDLAGGSRVLLKSLARGGLFGPLWRGRHPGSGRLMANLTVPAEARARGIRTPAARALFVESGSLGTCRGWLAVDALEGDDLIAVLSGMPADLEGVVRDAAETVRDAHDAGLRHPDLNLGNLFRDTSGSVHVLDLDGARLEDRPIGAWRRFRELTRLARSWGRKLGGGTGGAALDRLIRAYCAGRPELARRLRRFRPIGRGVLVLRSIGR